ncbi:acetaldehyde dehydrogenase (acetylating) [Hornefia butyriciproducens]|uniref:acetaldehyde dehydrogenase (acetylating) n=1 Tax=Hornefia butyriciproducens TaxID=2652293 RepID=UPI003CFE91DD
MMFGTYDKDLESIQEARVLARQGQIAAEQFADYTEEQVERILQNIVKKAVENAVPLAKAAVEDTGFGTVKDKVFKNYMAAKIVYDYIRNMKTIGVLEEDPVNKVISVAEPMGLIMGIVPSTNPTSTVIYKSMISLKARDAIVFSPHPSAFRCTKMAADIVAKAAEEAGAPRNVVQCISLPTMEATDTLMRCNEVKMIIATGGPGMVKAAYSVGKPALGVGAGNSPSYIERTANIHQSVKDIINSKTFDNGTICASEQSVVVDACVESHVINEFKAQGGYFMTPEETDRVCSCLFKNGHTMKAAFVGRSAEYIADKAGINVPSGTKVLIGRQAGVGPEYPLSYEKLTTVLAFYTVKDCNEACELSYKLLQNGLGHTMNVHTEDPRVAMAFSVKPASRILINIGGSQGGTGMCSGLAPAFTLGCGTCGGSATSENVSPLQLINVKKVVRQIRTVNDVLAANPILKEMLDQLEKSDVNRCSDSVPSLEDMLAVRGQDYIPIGCCTGKQTDPGKISEEELRELINRVVASLKK